VINLTLSTSRKAASQTDPPDYYNKKVTKSQSFYSHDFSAIFPVANNISFYLTYWKEYCSNSKNGKKTSP